MRAGHRLVQDTFIKILFYSILFLANPKQKFPYFIGSELDKAGVELSQHHSAGDADYDIV